MATGHPHSTNLVFPVERAIMSDVEAIKMNDKWSYIKGIHKYTGNALFSSMNLAVYKYYTPTDLK